MTPRAWGLLGVVLVLGFYAMKKPKPDNKVTIPDDPRIARAGTFTR